MPIRVQAQPNRFNINAFFASLICIGAIALSSMASSGVPVEVADRLGNDLTPMGSQKSGNKAGTIPEWTGGLQSPPANVTYKLGDRHPNPFADDKILFTITAQNKAQYEKNLTETTKAMLAAYPDTYKMHVYPGRRSCAQPAAIYESIKNNALTSAETPDGAGLSGAIHGTAFPIPSTAQQFIWNHKLKFRNFKVTRQFVAALPTRSGDFNEYVVQDEVMQDYSNPAKKDVSELNNISLRYIANTIAPARAAGNVVMVHETIDQSQSPRKAWVYSPGTRRVRRAPDIAYDNPGTNTDGLQTVDSFDGYNGATDRYDWTYVGRQEAYLPANNYDLALREHQYKDIFLAGGHINQDFVRYELQRSEMIEANLRAEFRHLYPKRKFWIETDAWQVSNTSQYDARGALWRAQEEYGYTYFEVPVCGSGASISYDLNAGRYLVLGFTNQEPQINFFADELKEDRYTPDAIRRLGVR